MAVSYTHLDVYKRQVVKSTIICFVPRILVGIIPYFVYRGIVKLTTSSHAKAAKVISNLVISVLLPVSYTHLDVYKRQISPYRLSLMKFELFS